MLACWPFGILMVGTVLQFLLQLLLLQPWLIRGLLVQGHNWKLDWWLGGWLCVTHLITMATATLAHQRAYNPKPQLELGLVAWWCWFPTPFLLPRWPRDQQTTKQLGKCWLVGLLVSWCSKIVIFDMNMVKIPRREHRPCSLEPPPDGHHPQMDAHPDGHTHTHTHPLMSLQMDPHRRWQHQPDGHTPRWTTPRRTPPPRWTDTPKLTHILHMTEKENTW